jgi:dTDP-glucose 4,6-dehydratase
VRQPDISKAQRVLGWSPQVTLEAGLEKTLPWFREQLQRRGEL